MSLQTAFNKREPLVGTFATAFDLCTLGRGDVLRDLVVGSCAIIAAFDRLGYACAWSGQFVCAEDALIELDLALRKRQFADALRQIAKLSFVLETLRENSGNATVTFTRATAAPILPKADAGPMQVEVISMPTRVTTTEVERDAKDNIKTARQIERDAVSA